MRWPSTSTTHMRHTPATLRSGWLQSVGMSTPTVLAASRMVMPNGTLVSMPSMVTETRAPMASGLSETGTVLPTWLVGMRGAFSSFLGVSVMLRSSRSRPGRGGS